MYRETSLLLHPSPVPGFSPPSALILCFFFSLPRKVDTLLNEDGGHRPIIINDGSPLAFERFDFFSGSHVTYEEWNRIGTDLWTRSDGESGTVMITLIIEAVDTSDRQERKRLRNRETEGEKKALIFRESGTRSA